jgi:uncharacterized protein
MSDNSRPETDEGVMKIHLHEITDIETELDFTQEEPWVLKAVEAVDEVMDDTPGLKSLRPTAQLSSTSKPRPVQAHFSLRKVDDVVVVQGNVDTKIQLICSRCANPFHMEAHPHFSGLFCKDPVMAGVGHLQEKGKPGGQNKGFARHAHDESLDAPGSQGQDLDITYLSTDTIDLKEILTEQLQLQIPFQPLCREECKGMCSNCGADLNVGRCACAKVVNSHPFAALRDMKF